MGMDAENAAQELAKDPSTIAEAKRLKISPLALARQKAASIAGITGSVDNVGALQGAMSSAQDFVELDPHSAGSDSDHQAGIIAAKRAAVISERRAKLKRSADRKYTKSKGGLASLVQGLIGGDSNIQGTISDLGGEGLGDLGSHLDASRADVEARIEAEAQKILSSGGAANIDAAREMAKGANKGALGKEKSDLDQAQKRLQELKEEKAGIQPVRVVGDFRLVDDEGNTVSLQSSNKN
jgi:hypothetical protein